MKILTCPKRAPFAVLLLFLSLTVLAPPGTCAQESKKSADGKNQASNLHVISDEMVAEQKASMVEFIGNVKATRDDSVLTADSVKVFFHDSKAREKQQTNVKKIVATGNVEYTAGERKAFADKAEYTTEDEVLVLTGKSPRLLTGKSYVTGKKITLFRLEERVMVESDGSRRVQAFFDSQDQNQPTGKPKKTDQKKE